MNKMFGDFINLANLPDDEDNIARVQENILKEVTFQDGILSGSIHNELRGVSALSLGKKKKGFGATTDYSVRGLKHVIAQARRNLKAIDGMTVPPIRNAQNYVRVCNEKDASQKEMYEITKEADHLIDTLCPACLARKVTFTTDRVSKRIRTGGGLDACSVISRTNLKVLLSSQAADGTAVTMQDSFGCMGFSVNILNDLPAFTSFVHNLYEDLMNSVKATTVCEGEQLCIFSETGILIHEALGHSAEGDSVVSGSMLLGKMGEPIVSPLISVTDFALSALGDETPQPMKADDEGTACIDAPIIKNGILVGYLHNKDTAETLNSINTGNARAATFADMPIVRMRSTAILPGSSTLDQMISATDNGIFVKRFGGGSADINGKFMFDVQSAYQIHNGKIGGALKSMTCSGNSLHTLKKADMVGQKENAWRYSSLCAKQGQIIPVGMTGPAIRCIAAFNGR